MPSLVATGWPSEITTYTWNGYNFLTSTFHFNAIRSLVRNLWLFVYMEQRKNNSYKISPYSGRSQPVTQHYTNISYVLKTN